MGKKVYVANYNEGLDILAKELRIPLPEDDLEGRREYVRQAIKYFLQV